MIEWHDFFIAVAGASAALTGLIFVGISISLKKILSISGLPDRALLSLLLLLNVLVISLLFLVPGQTIKTLGVEILIVGLIAYAIIFKLDLRIFKHKQNKFKRLYSLHFLINHAATIPFIMVGFALTMGWANGLYWVVAGTLLSIIKAILDGWVLLVEINR